MRTKIFTSVNNLPHPGISDQVIKNPESSMLESDMNLIMTSCPELVTGAGGGEVELQYVPRTCLVLISSNISEMLNFTASTKIASCSPELC